jgi:hypothetical protein
MLTTRPPKPLCGDDIEGMSKMLGQILRVSSSNQTKISRYKQSTCLGMSDFFISIERLRYI